MKGQIFPTEFYQCCYGVICAVHDLDGFDGQPGALTPPGVGVSHWEVQHVDEVERCFFSYLRKWPEVSDAFLLGGAMKLL
jgi:hypothetical protein